MGSLEQDALGGNIGTRTHRLVVKWVERTEPAFFFLRPFRYSGTLSSVHAPLQALLHLLC